MKEQTVRSNRVWIKITKPSTKRFELHTGYQGDVKSFNTQIWPTSALPTWDDAIKLAEFKVKNW